MNKEELRKKLKINRNNTPNIMYSVVGKIGTNEVLEVKEINIKTKKEKIVFQDKKYKKLREKLNK